MYKVPEVKFAVTSSGEDLSRAIDFSAAYEGSLSAYTRGGHARRVGAGETDWLLHMDQVSMSTSASCCCKGGHK